MPDMYHLSLEALIVQQAIQGDKQAFGQLYEIYADRIFRYLYFRTGSVMTAEDMMCDVFLKAWTALPSFGAKGNEKNFNAWLYRIAHNRMIDHRRTSKDELSLDQLGEIRSSTEKPEKMVEKNDETALLIHSLNLLDETSREVLVNRFVAGLSHRETAAMLGLKENYIRVIQYRAIKKMHGLMGGNDG